MIKIVPFRLKYENRVRVGEKNNNRREKSRNYYYTKSFVPVIRQGLIQLKHTFEFLSHLDSFPEQF